MTPEIHLTKLLLKIRTDYIKHYLISTGSVEKTSRLLHLAPFLIYETMKREGWSFSGGRQRKRLLRSTPKKPAE